MKYECYKKEDCRLCQSRNLELVIELTPTPPGNHFVTAENLHKVQKAYPLEGYFCRDCFHLQLGHVVNPEILYQRQYSYVSGTSPVFVAHLRDYASYIIDRFKPDPRKLVIDIGSNDGTALSFFQKAGYKVLGVDPAVEIVEDANKRGIETLCEFFGSEVARRNSGRYGQAGLITSHNACAHIDDLAGVIDGVQHWLADDGLFVMEVGYLLDIYQNTWFDTIYHEHVDFHSVEPLAGFLRRHGFEVISAQRISPQGGSIRLISQKIGGGRQPDGSVQELIRLEHGAGLNKAETFKAFNAKINVVKDNLSKLVAQVKGQGKTIAGYGAPTKATTLLTHFNLGSALDFLVDDNPLKQGLFSPGHHIPVFSADELYLRKPNYLLILAWNFAENIMERNRRFRDQGGAFMLPMPQPHIVN